MRLFHEDINKRGTSWMWIFTIHQHKSDEIRHNHHFRRIQ